MVAEWACSLPTNLRFTPMRVVSTLRLSINNLGLALNIHGPSMPRKAMHVKSTFLSLMTF